MSEGGMSVGFIENESFMMFSKVDFGFGAASFDVRVASGGDGENIELRLDSLTGPLVGTCTVENTEGWQKWVTKSCAVSSAAGMHDLYFKFTGGNGFLFNMGGSLMHK